MRVCVPSYTNNCSFRYDWEIFKNRRYICIDDFDFTFPLAWCNSDGKPDIISSIKVECGVESCIHIHPSFTRTAVRVWRHPPSRDLRWTERLLKISSIIWHSPTHCHQIIYRNNRHVTQYIPLSEVINNVSNRW